MLRLSWGLFIFSTLQWPVAYLTPLGNSVYYVTGLSILALQYAAITAIAGSKAEKEAKDG